jgi:hypothetical protein
MSSDHHDLDSHIDRLRQALESTRRPIALFIGAGCPMAVPDAHDAKPLIPDVKAMTKIMTTKLEASAEHAKTFERLKGILAEDNKRDADLEYILSLVRTLRDVAGESDARGLTRDNLEGLDEAISEVIASLAKPSLPGLKTPYHDAMRWVGEDTRQSSVEIFTTNYDLLAEQALEDSGVPFFDGFVGARHPFFDVRAIEDDELPTRWARLWKLHGSITWCQEPGGRVVRRPDSDRITRRLIHPSHLKYDESRRMPYLALHDRLRQLLRRTDVVVVSCGYSFRDEHLNEILKEGLERNRTGVLFGLLFGKLSGYPEAVDLATDTRASNVLLLAEDAGVVGRDKAPWRELDDPTSVAHIPGMRVTGSQPSCYLGDFAELAGLLRGLTGRG